MRESSRVPQHEQREARERYTAEHVDAARSAYQAAFDAMRSEELAVRESLSDIPKDQCSTTYSARWEERVRPLFAKLRKLKEELNASLDAHYAAEKQQTDPVQFGSYPITVSFIKRGDEIIERPIGHVRVGYDASVADAKSATRAAISMEGLHNSLADASEADMARVDYAVADDGEELFSGVTWIDRGGHIAWKVK